MIDFNIATGRAAEELVGKHGRLAPIRAAMRIDAMAKSGDLDGYVAWIRILKRVEELLSPDHVASKKTH